jgi:hypothetical protein
MVVFFGCLVSHVHGLARLSCPCHPLCPHKALVCICLGLDRRHLSLDPFWLPRSD